MEILRLIAVGNVDDGKSTLLGRLLLDSQALFTDQIEALTRSNSELNLAHVTNGLKSERENGITIDVAYRFFNTPRRKFVVMDAPGHFQYTRNMVTGASNADAGLLLIDASRGIEEQTRRHAYLLSLLRVSRVIVCVNKMDLVGFSQEIFERLRANLGIPVQDIAFIPISSLKGDNVTSPSANLSWYHGPTLLELLENTPPPRKTSMGLRFPIQGKLSSLLTGMITSGEISVGDEVRILPSGKSARVSALHKHPDRRQRCSAGESIAVELDSGPDGISRGDWLVSASAPDPAIHSETDAEVWWFSETPLAPGSRLILRIATKETSCEVRGIRHRVDLHDFSEKAASRLEMNDIGRICLKTPAPVCHDSYGEAKATGSGILIDPRTQETVAALMF